jgi:hypothetical protein
MRMRRAHEHRMRLARQVHIVGVAAGTGDEARIFQPRQRAADIGNAFVRAQTVHLAASPPEQRAPDQLSGRANPIDVT